MKYKSSVVYALGAASAMLLLIPDAKTALEAARSGVELCIRTVIPSLFPFLVLSAFMIGNLPGGEIPMLRFLGKICKIPRGAEPLLLTGLLGGYPVGAQCIFQAYQAGQVSEETAHRLLGFCSNAGPAFIFGMLSPLFSSSIAVWCLWGIHILSAVTAAVLLPGTCEERISASRKASVSFPGALQQGLGIMASICGWVVVFRIITVFCDRWFLWVLPNEFRIILIGVLELTNGCTVLSDLPVEGTRFLLCALFLGLGGVCVGMQTVSATGSLGTGMYFPGKIMQASISVLIAIFLQPILFPAQHRCGIHPITVIAPVICICVAFACLKKQKNSSSNLQLQGV